MTSPPTHPEIEEVFGDGVPASLRAAPADSLLGEWRRLGAFLKQPTLAVSAQNAAPLKVLARIYALDIAVMFVLIAAATTAVAMGIYIPETALAGMEFTLTIVLLVVVGAPVLEEVVFRGWLSGRPGPILALASLGAGLTVFALVHTSNPILGVVLAIVGIAGAGIALVMLRNRGPMAWFERFFPAFFWLATVSFALVHLANFDEGSLAILLPLVLPQFVLGMLLGYVRVRFALWAAILLHAAHNATAISIAAVAGQLA